MERIYKCLFSGNKRYMSKNTADLEVLIGHFCMKFRSESNGNTPGPPKSPKTNKKVKKYVQTGVGTGNSSLRASVAKKKR